MLQRCRSGNKAFTMAFGENRPEVATTSRGDISARLSKLVGQGFAEPGLVGLRLVRVYTK